LKRFNAIRHKFGNGLRLITVPTNKVNDVFIQICIGAGSCQEKMGSRGMAHLTEHLVIDDFLSGNLRNQNGFSSLRMSGGSTHLDYTLFTLKISPEIAYRTIKNILTKFFSIKRPSQEELSRMKETINQERKGKIHRKARGRIYEELYKVAYRRHPYRWYIFGKKRDYLRLTPQEVFQFYHSFYVPNNTVVVVYGPVLATKLINSLNKQINAIASSPLPKQDISPEPPQIRPKYRTIISNRTAARELLLIGYKIPPLGHIHLTGLRVLNYVLFQKRSGFRKILTKKKGQVKYAFGHLPLTKYEGLYEIFLSSPPGYSVEAAKDTFFDVIKRYTTGKISTKTLESAKRRALQELNQIKNKPKIFSEYLAIYEILLNDYSAFFYYQDSIKNLTKNSFLLSLRTIVQKNHMTAITIKPEQ